MDFEKFKSVARVITKNYAMLLFLGPRRVRIDLLRPERMRNGGSFVIVYPVTHSMYVDLDQVSFVLYMLSQIWEVANSNSSMFNRLLQIKLLR